MKPIQAPSDAFKKSYANKDSDSDSEGDYQSDEDGSSFKESKDEPKVFKSRRE